MTLNKGQDILLSCAFTASKQLCKDKVYAYSNGIYNNLDYFTLADTACGLPDMICGILFIIFRHIHCFFCIWNMESKVGKNISSFATLSKKIVDVPLSPCCTGQFLFNDRVSFIVQGYTCSVTESFPIEQGPYYASL